MYRGRIRSKKELVEFVLKLLKGKKEIPDFITSNRELSKIFLRIFFGAEGSISIDRKYPKIEISTTTKKLQEQLQQMLLSLGIRSRIYSNGIHIREKESVKRFIKEIGVAPVFRIGRGKFAGMKKVDVLNFYLKYMSSH